MHAGGYVNGEALASRSEFAVLVRVDSQAPIGQFHALRNREYGTRVVAGVTPGKGGEDVQGIPVFDTVAEAMEATGANASLVFVPPRFAADAMPKPEPETPATPPATPQPARPATSR